MYGFTFLHLWGTHRVWSYFSVVGSISHATIALLIGGFSSISHIPRLTVSIPVLAECCNMEKGPTSFQPSQASFPGSQALTLRNVNIEVLPRSGTQTLKLCRRGEPGIFEKPKVERGGRETLIVRGHTRLLRTGKRAAANLLHLSSYRRLNIIRTEHWTHSWLNNAQNVDFLF